MKTKFLFSVFTLFIFSCQKTPTQPATSSPTATTPPPVAASALVYGNLEVLNVYRFDGTSYSRWGATGVYCFFSSQGIYSGNSADNIPGGAITLNNRVLKFYATYNNFACQYYDTTAQMQVPPASWNVTGQGIIPAFSTTLNDAFPLCNNASQIPDTISPSQGITIPISGSGADSVTLHLFVNSGNSGIGRIKTVAATNANVSFSPQEVADIFSVAPTDKYRSVGLYYSKYSVQTFSGKQMVFKTTSRYQHNIEQKP